MAGSGEQQRLQIELQARLKNAQTLIDRAAVHRLAVVQALAHVGMLCTTTCEHEGHAARHVGGGFGDHALGIGQCLGCIRAAVGNYDATQLHGLSADLQRVGSIGEIDLGLRLEKRRQRFSARVERFHRARRLHEHLQAARRFARSTALRCLLDDDVRVGTADAERTHAGAARHALRRIPRNALGVQIERRALEITRRVARLEVQQRRNLAGLHRFGDGDETRHTSSGVGVADVGLHRTECAPSGFQFAGFVGALAVSLRQRRDFDRVADRRAGAVRRDIGDRLRRHVGNRHRLGNRLRLAIDTRRHVADLLRAVVVDRRAFDDGVDVVAVGDRIGQAAKHDDADAAAEHGALRCCIEGAAMAVGREDFVFAVEITVTVRLLDRHAAGQRHVALAVEQALHAAVNRHQRGRARRLHVDARPAQVEQVRDARRQKVLVVAGVADEEEADAGHQLRIAHQVQRHVGVVARAAEDADRAAELVRHMARVLERFPRHFEEVAVLRIHDRRFARREAEELGVELLHVGQHGADLDVVRVGELGGIHTHGSQLGFSEWAQRLNAVAQVVPVLVDRACAGKAAGHADDGNVGVERLGVVVV